MTKVRWFRSGTPPRGTPVFRRALRRHPVIALVFVLAALSQTGCKSGPYGCGGCGGKVRGLSERVFRPIKKIVRGGGCTNCGSDLGTASAPGLTYGYSSPAVVTPAPSGVGIGVPSNAGTTTVVPNGPEVGAPALEPIPAERTPSAVPGPAPSGAGAGLGGGSDASPATQGAKTSTGKANYEAFRPIYRDDRTISRAPTPRTLIATPEPTPRSAQGPSRSRPAGSEVNPLDNLPPLNLSLDVPQVDQTPPAPQAPAPAREARPSASNLGPPPTADTLADLAARPATAEVSVAPGIRRFAGVESKLAGGSLPSPAGLDWLAEKGYRTILDLREVADISPTFITDVSSRGMRYLALPIHLKNVDADRVSRFNFEVSLSDARPLYFCDTDGTRAGVMWYIRRVSVDKVGEIVARRDAEELGLSDRKFWLAAESYLKGVKPSAATGPVQAPAAEPAGPAQGAPRPARDKTAVSSGDSGSNAPSAPSAGPSPGESADSRKPLDDPRDPTAWKSVAALVVTGLGVPLAYMSRSVPSGFVTLARASLPGPRRST